jgi:cystathionine beta-lyase
MKYNFDEVIKRRGSGSVKWDTVKDNVIPLWVADMDFPCLREIQEALVQRASHPFYGYPRRRETYYEAIQSWYRTMHNFEPELLHLLTGPGTVLSLGMIVRECTREAEGVLLLTPVYTPFFEVVKENGRKVVEVPLKPDKWGRFILNIEKIEEVINKTEAEGTRVSLALFCSPHNPGGRVWAREEIAAFLAMAERHDITVAADEIHGDFVYSENAEGKEQHFVSAASLEKYAERLIVVSGANKSFNLGGLHVSHFVIRDSRLRQIIKTALHREAHHEGDVFAELAVETAYRHGELWLTELRAYLKGNILEAVNFLNSIGLKAFVPDGTYLIWAHAQELAEKTGCRDETELVRRLEDEAMVKITQGSIYGKAGAGYVRINAASPRSILMEGLGRIKDWAGR